MAIKRMPIGLFMAELQATVDRKDGYIMGAKGQDPKKLSSWYFNQYADRDNYSAKQEAKALYWKENAQFVWDCNGLSEGIYEKWSGVNINTKARYAYADWCGVKGKGMIPVERRVPGASVYWGEKASNIHHVAYLDKPVVEGKPEGDWYIIEARGVLYGCVRTTLYDRKPNFWGLMDKYFDYNDADYVPSVPELGEIILKKGMQDRADVKKMQLNLIALGYDLGERGADGDFGSKTESALEAFQLDHNLTVDGEYDAETHAAMLVALEIPIIAPDTSADDLTVKDGSWRVRTGPGTAYPTAGFVHGGDKLTKIDLGNWQTIMHKDEVRFISKNALKEA